MPQEENTPITVSADDIREWRIRFISSAKITANTTITSEVFATPSSSPMPTPVSAECPSASEKKDIPLLTTSVPSMENSGIISTMASSALRIKL